MAEVGRAIRCPHKPAIWQKSAAYELTHHELATLQDAELATPFKLFLLRQKTEEFGVTGLECCGGAVLPDSFSGGESEAWKIYGLGDRVVSELLPDALK